jgi:hypothetical protein
MTPEQLAQYKRAAWVVAAELGYILTDDVVDRLLDNQVDAAALHYWLSMFAEELRGPEV